MKVLLIKTNTILCDKEIDEIRKNILNQIDDRGVLVLDNFYTAEIVEFDAVKVGGELVNTE